MDVGGKEFNKLKFFLLPISSVEETKGMKVTFFIYAWIFLLELQRSRITATRQPCNTQFFLLSNGHHSGLRFYCKQRHFEFVPRRTQADCSKKCHDGINKGKIFGSKTAEVTRGWEKLHNGGLYVFYHLNIIG